MKATCNAVYQTAVIRNGKTIPLQRVKNLIVDQGLNAFAFAPGLGLSSGRGIAFAVDRCYVGSGTNPTSINSGAITFTQAAFTVTASGAFFAPSMVGCILKYGSGSGGAEYYITGYTSSTIVTVDISATVGAIIGVVWFVQQTTLQTQIAQNSVVATTRSNTASTLVVQSVFTFAPPLVVMNINEIGWSDSAMTANLIDGRSVLPSTDVIGTTDVYVVTITVTWTLSPITPTVVGNVGTAIDTSGDAMLNLVGWGGFGATSEAPFDFNNTLRMVLTSEVTPALASTLQVVDTATPPWTIADGAVPYNVDFRFVYANSRGLMVCVVTILGLSGLGGSIGGIGFSLNQHGSDFHPVFALSFAAPQAVSDPFSGSFSFSLIYGRVLINP